MSSSNSPVESGDVSQAELDQVRSLLSDVKQGAQSVREAAKGWKDRYAITLSISTYL